MSMMFFAVSSKPRKEHVYFSPSLQWATHSRTNELIWVAHWSNPSGNTRKGYHILQRWICEEMLTVSAMPSLWKERNCGTFEPMETNVQGMVVD